MTTPTRINRQDLKIYPSERLTDNDDGGGMPLGHPLTGAVNELFNPISSIARVNGAFYARLEYAGVLRADDAPLIGAFMAITKPPNDDSVSYLLFKATRFGESRAEILKRIEAFNVGTIESRMTLLSVQSANSKIVQAYQTVGEPLPVVGDVFCLRQDKAGYPYAEQYIQVTRLSSEEREFVDKNGKKFKKTVVKLEISSKLEADFIGVDYPEESYVNNPCKIRETNVADAAQYYGVKPLAAAIEKDASKIKITSLMEKLVPINQISTKLVDLTAAGQRQTLFDGSRAGADGLVTLAVNKNHTAGQITSLYFGNAVTPNSVNLVNSSGQITDKGGTLYANGAAVGSMDYARGLALISEPTFSDFLNTLKFRPAAAELRVADTMRINVDINNRSDSYTFNINPPPAVGTLMVSYRSQGRWYDLTDDGNGVLRGASVQHGSGSISFTTGTGSISTGELPDVGSAILLSWGTRANYFNRGGRTIASQIPLALNQKAVASSITLTVTDDNGKTQTAQANRLGVFSGAFGGRYDATGQRIILDKINASLTGRPVVSVTYSTSNQSNNSSRVPSLNGTQVTLNMDGMVKGAWQFTWGAQDTAGTFAGWRTYYDDGLGHLIDEQNNIVGNVDYAAKTATFDCALPQTYAVPVFVNETIGGVTRQVITGYKNVVGSTRLFAPNGVIGQFNVSGAVPDGDMVTQAFPLAGLQLALSSDFNEVVIPSSLNFILNGIPYFDRQGQIFCNLDPKTGAATLAGTINYQSGLVNLTHGQLGSLGAVTLTSLVTGITGNPVDAVTFRTPQSPIRAGSLQIRATAVDGTLITARAAYSGDLKAANVEGKVDAEFGVADIRFGNWVTVTDDVKKQPWYVESAVVTGKIWQPKHVFAESITYNADAYTYLPVDNSIVKIDTVRLPQDGRVPIFQRGDTVLIGNRTVQDIGSAFTGGQTVQLNRKDLDRICINDANGKPVNAELWDYDLDAGTITFKTALDLSPYKMPLNVMHAQEERNRILSADIDGSLNLIFPTKRAYSLENTYVSSLLIGGDLQVRVSVPFTQRNWNSVWSDLPVGEALLNKLNLKDYPMLLTDDGAITDRWLIKFTSGSQFELYSEALGFVGKYDTLTHLAPLNPATNKPYFTIPKQAFGSSLQGGAPWAAQDVLRFNTWGTLMPVWVLCAVQPSSTVQKGEDGFSQCLFGDTTEI